ncbi:hypothetical protein K0M31_013337 [Melipona bicolor]|uniref:Uncharacterized protein n=1 Tax=Melipona bicolor TaxID=60889 RepID=A0AA40KGM1_9HYME|nr:hypothetical protein K0M31_013337 [Melipona bicolor]
MRRERLAKIRDLIFMGGGRVSPRLLNPLPTFTGPISNEVGVSFESRDQSWRKSKKKRGLVSQCLSRFAGILIEGEEQGGREQARQLAVGWSGVGVARLGVGTEEESANTEGWLRDSNNLALGDDTLGKKGLSKPFSSSL